MIQLPTNTQRLACVGTTGSGKTQAAVWHLSKRNISEFPWIIFNWKEDELLDSIPHAHYIGLEDTLRSVNSGLFVVTPSPAQDDDVEKILWRIWEKRNIGILIDEGYMISTGSDALTACLTQGRSRYIPMIVCSQRPVWLSRFVWSESEFFQVFDLSIEDDKDTIEGYAPSLNLHSQLPEHWSWYYDKKRKEVSLLKPVPKAEKILSVIEQKLQVRRKKII